VLAHIEMNFARAIGLAELAELAEIHPSHLCREFRKHVGCSPLEHVKKTRIQRAAILLQQSEKSVKEISLSVGFKRAEAFSKAFKKLMGCSPRHFRASGDNQNNNDVEENQF
jgi:AraC-like DNA-binding protein